MDVEILAAELGLQDIDALNANLDGVDADLAFAIAQQAEIFRMAMMMAEDARLAALLGETGDWPVPPAVTPPQTAYSPSPALAASGLSGNISAYLSGNDAVSVVNSATNSATSATTAAAFTSGSGDTVPSVYNSAINSAVSGTTDGPAVLFHEDFIAPPSQVQLVHNTGNIFPAVEPPDSPQSYAGLFGESEPFGLLNILAELIPKTHPHPEGKEHLPASPVVDIALPSVLYPPFEVVETPPLSPFLKAACSSFWCTACTDAILDDETHLRAPCGDIYCYMCTLRMVDAATSDVSLFPLSCCQRVIPSEDIATILPPDKRPSFRDKTTEHTTNILYRVYCPIPTCTTFLGSSKGYEGNWLCTSCKLDICGKCKQQAHPGDTCQGYVGSILLKELVQSQAWQTCPKCKAVVERTYGCDHMSCRCGTQFCYRCAKLWKTCSCA
ncbi:hypothetical protein BDQ17DRAFT_260716 [Cyathus striatus]|nr:hypothetical protein BDQ17DRAFT_260716 [Cyathus striatus]